MPLRAASISFFVAFAFSVVRALFGKRHHISHNKGKKQTRKLLLLKVKS
jgi:hypothetical protein